MGKEDKSDAGGRLDALTDGVVAIAITLLVLDLHVPENIGELSSDAVWQLLAGMRGQFRSYFVSFGVVAIFWLNHVGRVRNLSRTDPLLIWLNLAFLAAIGLVPFTTALLSRSTSNAAATVYALNMAAGALLISATASYAEVRGLSRSRPRPASLSLQLSHFCMPAVFLISALVSAWSRSLAEACWFLSFPVSFIMNRAQRRADSQ